MASETAPMFGWETIASGAEGPGPRSRHGLVYDRGAKATVLFGGIIWDARETLKSDTWELRNRRWFPIEIKEKPPARHRGAMVYDSRRGQSVLFGGQGSTNEFLRDTWTYADRSWQQWRTGEDRRWWQWRTASGGPSARCGHSMAFDESAGVTVLFGGIDPSDRPLGDTWLFDGNSWWRVPGPAPSARRYAAFAFDPDLKGCLLHGGAEDDRGRRTFGDAWLFRDQVWTRLGAGFETNPRDDHGLAYHRGAQRLVMLEGLAGTRGILVREASGWRTVEASPLHPRHQCSPLAWDEGLGGLVMHGGEVSHGGPQFDTTLVLQLSTVS
jgi:hypothetical protein